MNDNLKKNVTELVCTRISHDLIGNVGAVGNAVELLEEGDMDFLEDINGILSVSSKVLASRLKFFRMAFGLSNNNLQDIALVAETAQAYLQTIGNADYPITLTLELHSEKYARVALLVIMILADVIIKGGTIEAREIDDGFAAVIHSQSSLSSEKMKQIKAILADEIAETQAQYAPVVYLQNLLNNEKKINIIEENTFGFVVR
ncbi:MAG: hypothetical protein IJ660_01410 [Alphaproteobacteria bacterium]|nr:hypothetical protein [Alphaproteobacteria bacterium]